MSLQSRDWQRRGAPNLEKEPRMEANFKMMFHLLLTSLILHQEQQTTAPWRFQSRQRHLEAVQLPAWRGRGQTASSSSFFRLVFSCGTPSGRDVWGTVGSSQRQGVQELAEGGPVPAAAQGGSASLRQPPHELLPRRAAAAQRPAEGAVSGSVQSQRQHGQTSLLSPYTTWLLKLFLYPVVPPLMMIRLFGGFTTSWHCGLWPNTLVAQTPPLPPPPHPTFCVKVCPSLIKTENINLTAPGQFLLMAP